MPKLLTILVLLLPLGTATADIYKRVLPDGTVVFSDQPGEDATKVDSPPIQTYTAPPAPPVRKRTQSTETPQKAFTYSKLVITAPAQDTVIWDNDGVVAVQVDVEPPLQTAQGHHLTLLMDGQKVTDLTAPNYTLRGVDRGTHTLQVAIVEDGKVLTESPTVQFHLKRHSVLRRTAPSN